MNLYSKNQKIKRTDDNPSRTDTNHNWVLVFVIHSTQYHASQVPCHIAPTVSPRHLDQPTGQNLFSLSTRSWMYSSSILLLLWMCFLLLPWQKCWRFCVLAQVWNFLQKLMKGLCLEPFFCLKETNSVQAVNDYTYLFLCSSSNRTLLLSLPSASIHKNEEQALIVHSQLALCNILQIANDQP